MKRLLIVLMLMAGPASAEMVLKIYGTGYLITVPPDEQPPGPSATALCRGTYTGTSTYTSGSFLNCGTDGAYINSGILCNAYGASNTYLGAIHIQCTQTITPPPPTPTPEQTTYCQQHATSSVNKSFGGEGTLPTDICEPIPDSNIGGSCKYTGADVGVEVGGSWYTYARGTGTACTPTQEEGPLITATSIGTLPTSPTSTTSTNNTTNTTQNPDGSTTNTQTSTTTTIKEGTVTTSDTTTIVTETGATVEKTVTTTTTTNADGTKTVTTDTTYTGYTPPTHTVSYNPVSGSNEVTSTPQTVTSTGSTSETTNYDSNGTATGTTTINYGGGAIGAQQQTEPPETCGLPGKPKCQVEMGTPGPLPTDGKTFGETTGGLMGRIGNAPIVQATKNITMGSAGMCPTATFSVFNHLFIMDAHCTIAESMSNVLLLAALAAWALLGVMIVLSA